MEPSIADFVVKPGNHSATEISYLDRKLSLGSILQIINVIYRFVQNNVNCENVFSFFRVKIYALNVTNALNGGADRCLDCPLGVVLKG